MLKKAVIFAEDATVAPFFYDVSELDISWHIDKKAAGTFGDRGCRFTGDFYR